MSARRASTHPSAPRAPLVAALAVLVASVTGCGEKKRRVDLAPTPDEPSATASATGSAGLAASASASATATATALATTEPLPTSAPTDVLDGLDLGPAPPSATATRDERQKAVLALLAGGGPLPSLPQVATEPGAPWDDGLRARLTTRKPPQVRAGDAGVSGRLPPEVIKRIVRQNFGRFRLCYENGLKKNPALEGKLVVAFVIGTDGGVSGVHKQSSTIADEGVNACVVASFRNLSFPQPEGGVVKVTYPIDFKPG